MKHLRIWRAPRKINIKPIGLPRKKAPGTTASAASSSASSTARWAEEVSGCTTHAAR